MTGDWSNYGVLHLVVGCKSGVSLSNTALNAADEYVRAWVCSENRVPASKAWLVALEGD